ncbi:MAG TPA: DUF2507 domain-containing protein [Savagea sp.]
MDQKTESAYPTKFGYELLKDHVLPSVLGKHEDDILYWVGKEIARKFPLFSIEELPAFFTEAGWGKLELIKDTAQVNTFLLTRPSNSVKEKGSISLEVGFIAQQYQILTKRITEAHGTYQKDSTVSIDVKWE